MSVALKRRQIKLAKVVQNIDKAGHLDVTTVTIDCILGAINKVSAIHPGSVTIEEFADMISLYKFHTK